ncbi:MAG: glycosyl transferase, partial [Mycobacteriaceae bacterium]|nr:glycosyl transferase [Mycobacteriaceae bacterium]
MAPVLTRVLDSAAPHISSWVIVDTGSQDGTPDLITSYMASRGIRGELYRRSAGSLGRNQEAALALAQDRGDYLWLLGVGDTLVGTADFTELGADIYWLRCIDDSGNTFWRAQLFRDGVRMRYQSIEDYVAADDDEISTGARLGGCYHIATGPTTVSSLGPEHKLARDRELLLVAVDRNPADARSVFELAQRYFDLGDFTNAHTWYTRRIEMGGDPEEVYYAQYQVAKSMENLKLPWPKVQDALLRAWESRPNRAEAPHAIASWYRIHQRYRFGYLFAQRAAEIPLP